MPEATTQLLIKVISLYKKGGLKGQKEVHGKNDIKFSSSSLITLQGLDVEERHELLLKVQNKIQTWDEMLSEAKTRKELARTRAAFVQLTNSDDWADAVANFPKHTEDSALKPYAPLFHSVKNFVMPQAFKNFVKFALDSKKTKVKQGNWSDYQHPISGKKLEYFISTCDILEQLSEYSSILENTSPFLADIPYGLNQPGSAWDIDEWKNPTEQVQKITNGILI